MMLPVENYMVSFMEKLGITSAEAARPFMEKLRIAEAEAAARDADPWRLPLERLQGPIGDDGVERISTQNVLDVLQIPQSRRRTMTYRRLAKLMVELGWSPVKGRGLTRGGYREQVRGFARDARNRQRLLPASL
jgi:hypothetical protein